MGRKSYRSGGTPQPDVKPDREPARRYTPRTTRPMPAKVDPIAESSYTYVRRDLLHIAVLALVLFSMLVLLRIATMALGLLP